MIFLKQIIAGQKHVLALEREPDLFLPQYSEFSIANLLNILAGDALVMSYIPDPATQTKTIPRKFAYRVACALRPGYMNDIIT